MQRQWIGGLLMGLMLAGCGSNGPSSPDTRPFRTETNTDVSADASPSDAGAAEDTSLSPIDTGTDPGCDEATLGEDYCIRNFPGGNGTPVARQKPVPYQSCKL